MNVYKISAELISATFVGTIIGVYLDKWLVTGPLFLVVGIVLGFGAGFRNLLRLGKRNGKSASSISDQNDNTDRNSRD